MAQFEAVTVNLLIMPLQIRRGTIHQAVVSVIGVVFQVAIVALAVEQVGGIACHTGRESCFYQELRDGHWLAVDPVLKNPEEIYP